MRLSDRNAANAQNIVHYEIAITCFAVFPVSECYYVSENYNQARIRC